MKMYSRLKQVLVLVALGYTMVSASAVFAAITCVPTPQQTSVLTPGATAQISYSCSLNGHIIPDSFSLRFQATSPVTVQPGGSGNPYTMTVSTPSDAASGTYSVSVTGISIKGGGFISASNGSSGPLEVIVQKPAPTAPTISWPANAADVSAVPDYVDHVTKVSWNANASVSSSESIQYAVSLNGADITSAECDVAQSRCTIPASTLTSGTQYTVSVKASAAGAKSVTNSAQFLWSPPAPTLQSIAVTPLVASIKVNRAQQFTATCTFSDNEHYPCPTLTWKSSDTNTATVNASGLATGVAAGSVNITASVDSITSPAAVLTITPLPQVVTPTFTPSGGMISPNTKVTMSDATAGAAIYYTTNGSTPTTQSMLYAGPVTVNPGETLKAMAAKNGYTSSTVGVASYTAPILQSIAVTPSTASIEVGHTQQFTAGCTFSDNKQYPCPTVTWKTSDQNTATVNANGLATGVAANTASITASVGTITSPPAELIVTAMPVVSKPTFNPPAGIVPLNTPVTISDATAGAAIYYTTDGSTPTTQSMLYSVPVTVNPPETLKAMATKNGHTSSTVSVAGYMPPTLESIAIAPLVASIKVGHTQQFTTTCTFSDDKQYPCPTMTWQSSDQSTATVNADGLATGIAPNTANITAFVGTITSPPAELTVTAMPVAATPTFSPAGGTYSSAQSVTISDTTPGAAIYYTVDGTTPTTNSMLYAGPISVSSTETIKAIAVAVGNAQSAVGSASYTINLVQVATPAFSPVGGAYTSAQSVTVSDTTTGAAIYYTTDGSTPTTASLPYEGPISVASSETINAIAVAAGYAQSAMGSASYTINAPQGAHIVVQSYSCTPSPLYANQNTICQVVLENTGGTASTELDYYAETLGIGGVGTVTGCSATLSPGQPCTASFTVTAPPSPNSQFGVMFFVDNSVNNKHLVKYPVVIPVIPGSGNIYATGISCTNAAVGVGGEDTCSAQIVNYGQDPVTPTIQPTANGVVIGRTASCSHPTQSGTPCTVTFQYAPTVMPSPNPATISYTYPSVAPPSTQVTVFNSKGSYIELNNFTCAPTSVNVGGDLQCSVTVKNVSGGDLSDLYYSVTGTNVFPFSIPSSAGNCGSITKQQSTCLLRFSFNAPTTPAQNLQLTLTGKHNLTIDASTYLSLPSYNIASGLLSCYPWALTPESNTAKCSATFTDNGDATSGMNTTVAASSVNHTTTSPVGGGCNGGVPTASCNYQFAVTATGDSPQAKVQVNAHDGSVLMSQQANFEYYPSNLVPMIFQCKETELQANGTTSCYVIFANRGTQSITPDVSISASTSKLTPTPPQGCHNAIPGGSTCRVDFNLTAANSITAVMPATVSVKSNGSTKDKVVMLVPVGDSAIVGSVNGAVDNYILPQTPITIPFYFTTQPGNQNTYYYTLHNLVVSNGQTLTSFLAYGGSCTIGDYLGGVAGCNERLENFAASNYSFLHPGDQVTFYAWMTYGTTKGAQTNTSNLVSWTVVLGDPPIFSQVLSNQLSIEGKKTFSGAFMFENNSTASISGLQTVIQDLPAGFSSDLSCSFNTAYANQQCGSNLTTLTPGQKCYACFEAVNPVTKGVNQYTLSGILQYAQSTAVDSKSFPVTLHHRKLTIYNNCGGPVWPAFVKGAAYYYCNHDADCPSGTVCYKAGHQCQVVPTFGDSALSCVGNSYAVPAAFQSQLQPGNNNVCSKGCNAHPGVCPQGSSCLGTGVCYWDLPEMTSNTSTAPGNPLNTYRIQSGKTAVFEFPNVPLTQAAGWSTVTSGAMYARTGCTIQGGALVCQTANCTQTDSKGACINGPLAPATKMEYTLLFENQDYYDVGVINGFNIPISMSPDTTAPSTESPYVCQPAGAPVTASIYGKSTSNVCTWQYNMINPNQNQPSQAHGALYKAQHTYVTNGSIGCGSSAPTPYLCSGSQVCGISQENVGNGTLTCGALIGFWSTNQLCSQPNASTANPTIYTNICAPWGTQPKSAWLGCSGSNGSENSCYQPGNPQGQCCGCPFWSGVYKPADKDAPLPSALQYLQQLFKTNSVTTLAPNGQNLYCKNYNSDWINNILLPELVWMKQGCTSTYTFAFDDPTSTFTCSSATGAKGDTVNKQNYTITLCPSPGTINGKPVVVPSE